MDDYDGLSLNAALSLCVRRASDLNPSSIKFIQELARRDKPITRAQGLRLAAMVARLRQDVLFAEPPSAA